MARHSDVIREVEESEEGSHIGAFFDFDGTVIYGFSALAMIREQLSRGDVSPRDLAKIMASMTSFNMGKIGFSALMTASSQQLKGTPEANYIELGEALYKKYIARLIYPESRALIEAHQRKGHTVAIISSATPYQLDAAARDLDVEHVMCTHYEIEDGVFTGRVEHPTCFGQGKVDAAERLASEHDIDLQQTFFYSDSDDDIELLEQVGKPRPLNPNRNLTAIAESKHWPIRRFASRGRPGVLGWARTLAATGAFIGSFGAALPIWGLTGSRREAMNFSTGLFADTTSALIGLKLAVTGEKNLWSQRPCVFVFNHQSKADVIILARLLRRDIAGVGKQEIKKMPIIGQIMEFAGVVMIDRTNAANAIEAMQPLVEAMTIEAKSVVLSPEGTRTVSPKLAPFKKGAFHLAMQAGVPMVPIVIHNALDSAPKGDIVYRPATVEVEVLPPVDTSSWSAETVNDHVDEVRGLFLKALGQDEPIAETATAHKRKPAQKAKPTGAAATKPATRSKS